MIFHSWKDRPMAWVCFISLTIILAALVFKSCSGFAYRDGQIDAIEGRIKYRRTTNTTTGWKLIPHEQRTGPLFGDRLTNYPPDFRFGIMSERSNHIDRYIEGLRLELYKSTEQ